MYKQDTGLFAKTINTSIINDQEIRMMKRNGLTGSVVICRWSFFTLVSCLLSLERLGFRSKLEEGIAIDWPVRYKDLAPWYDYV